MNMPKVSLFLILPLVLSCATITVNVYFPDKDVEAAFEDIESGLDFDMTRSKKDTEAVKSKSKSRSGAFFGVQPAFAEPKININAELKKMEDVQESLSRRKERLETLARLFDAGLVGLGKDGTIIRWSEENVPDGVETAETVFGADGGETALLKFISGENKDRKILIRGMAVATLRATEQDDTDRDALNSAIEKSTAIFAKRRLGELKPGWFYQDENDKWLKVEPPEEEPPAKKR